MTGKRIGARPCHTAGSPSQSSCRPLLSEILCSSAPNVEISTLRVSERIVAVTFSNRIIAAAAHLQNKYTRAHSSVCPKHDEKDAHNHGYNADSGQEIEN